MERGICHMIKKKAIKLSTSKAVILPYSFCQQLNIEIGTELELRLENNEILIRPLPEGDSHD